MKKVFKIFVTVVCLLFLLVPFTYSQVYRSVILENWTQTNCGPCASNNPQLKQWVSDNWANLTAISHHVWWPGANNDPMYLHNITENQARTTYYSIQNYGVPAGYMNGTHFYLGSPFPFSNMTTYYNMYSQQTTQCGMTVIDTRIWDSIR